MAAATADRDGQRSEGRLKSYQVAAATVIYKDTLVGVKADGYLTPMAHGTAGLIYVGVAAEKCDNAAGANGAKSCDVQKIGEFEFLHNAGAQAQANVGDVVTAFDDTSVDLAAATTNDYNVGAIQEVLSATKVRIRIDNYVL